MGDRITKKRLESVLDNLNACFDMESEPYTNTENGLKANAGVYVLDIAYGGYAVGQMSEGGGQSTVIGRGTARETYDQIQAYMAGARAMQNKLFPEYLVTAAVRGEGAQGVYQEKPFSIRVDCRLTGDKFTADVIKQLREKGYETRNIVKTYKYNR